MLTGPLTRFHPLRPAFQATERSGELDTTRISRLADVLAAPATARWTLRAGRDEAKRLVLHGEVAARVSAICQRCMEPVELPLQSDIMLAVVSDDEGASRLPASLDPVFMDENGEIDLAILLEDELLLAMPAVPMHENVADCGERASKMSTGALEEFDIAERENPFAVLKKLKQDKPD